MLKQPAFRVLLAGVLGLGIPSLTAAQDTPPGHAAPPSAEVGSAVQTAPEGAAPLLPCSFTGKWSYDLPHSDSPATLSPPDDTPGDAETGETGGGESGGYHGRAGGRGGRGPGGFGGMGGGSHGHRGRRPEAGPSAGGERGPVATAWRVLRDAPPILVVSQAQDQFEIVELGGRLARWKADDQSHADESLGAGAQTRARWDGITLRADSDLGPGGTLSQVYTLGQEAGGERQLRVTTTLRLTRTNRTLTLRRVYLPAP